MSGFSGTLPGPSGEGFPPVWHCTRQRAGPLVKECRALRPRLSPQDSPFERAEKRKILRPPRDSSVCRTRTDRVELRLALFGFEGTCYTLTFDEDSLPEKFRDVRRVWRAFMGRMKRQIGQPFDYVYRFEGLHGDHRYHIHATLRYSDFPPELVRRLWKYGGVDDEPLLRGPYDSFRRMARYYTKEPTDGLSFPVGARPCNWSRSLSARLPPPEKWMDTSGLIEIPDAVRVSGRNSVENAFGSYFYAWYIKERQWPPQAREAAGEEPPDEWAGLGGLSGEDSAFILDNDFLS